MSTGHTKFHIYISSTGFQDMHKLHVTLRPKLLRPVRIVVAAAGIALAMTLLLHQESFRNRFSDTLIIEALLLFIIAWLSHLKSGRLAFIAFHPFQKKTYLQDWKDRVPKLGSPPPTIEDTETEILPEEIQKKEKLARCFRRDLSLAGGALLLIGIVVQYV